MERKILKGNWPNHLHFSIRRYKNEWVAQCKEVGGIITGGGEKNPSYNKMMWWIRDATRCAMNLKELPRDLKITIINPN